jgi:hypothetical protein
MNLTAWVDVAIGVSVVYLGASLFVTILNEYWAQLLNSRGKQLYDSLHRLLDDASVKDALKKFPALQPFFGPREKAPSYLDTVVFARLLLGSFALDVNDPTRQGWLKAINTTLTADSTVKRQLVAVVNAASDKADDITKAVSEWTDRSLTMLGEGYKQRRQLTSLIIGLLLAVAGNLDTIAITSRLYLDKEARESAAEVGMQLTQATSRKQFDECLALPPAERKVNDSCRPLLGIVDAVTARSATLGRLPIGWGEENWPASKTAFGLKVVGWLLTALALSLGAPFWFDVLNRFVSIRHGMRKPDPTPVQ